ncbi:hypothetical protein LBMAG42_13970 [Deltaproteobacteria bacterium]|nr:hypothetical protein LBMAG42_13970 [Deltaproteobacteria bacterium]
MILLLLLGCEPEEVRQERCLGPVIELTKWRNGKAAEWLAGRDPLEPGQLRRDEKAKVDDAVERLRAAGSGCRSAWEMGVWTVPDTPPARLRDEALRRVLDLPAVDYTPVAVGPAGVTTDGRIGVEPKE